MASSTKKLVHLAPGIQRRKVQSSCGEQNEALPEKLASLPLHPPVNFSQAITFKQKKYIGVPVRMRTVSAGADSQSVSKSTKKYAVQPQTSTPKKPCKYKRTFVKC